MVSSGSTGWGFPWGTGSVWYWSWPDGSDVSGVSGSLGVSGVSGVSGLSWESVCSVPGFTGVTGVSGVWLPHPAISNVRASTRASRNFPYLSA